MIWIGLQLGLFLGLILIVWIAAPSFDWFDGLRWGVLGLVLACFELCLLCCYLLFLS